MTDHLYKIENPPFKVGQKVTINEDGPNGEIYRIVGATYEYRMVSGRGWNFWLATEHDIDRGYGGADGYGPDDIAVALTP